MAELSGATYKGGPFALVDLCIGSGEICETDKRLRTASGKRKRQGTRLFKRLVAESRCIGSGSSVA